MPRQTRLRFLLIWCVALAALLAGADTARGQAAARASAALKREDDLTPVWPLPGMPKLLGASDSRRATRLLYNRANLVVWPPAEAPHPTPGRICYRAGPQASVPIKVVEPELLGANEPLFRAAMAYLRAYSALARKRGTLPGVLDRGLAALAAYHQLYRTDRAWSALELEELAAYYLLVALNEGRPLGAAPTADEVKALLRRLHRGDPKGAAAVAHLLLNPVQRAGPAPENTQEAPDETVKADLRRKLSGFRLMDVLAHSVTEPQHRETPLPGGARTASERILQTVLEKPDCFPHLPSRYRLLRRCLVVSQGMAPAILARQKAGKPALGSGDPARLKREAAALEAIRTQCVEWFAREVKTRGGGTTTMRTEKTVSWDPYALSELTALLIETSVEYAAKVRVPVSEDPEIGSGQLAAMIEAAFAADKVIAGVFKSFGRPAVKVVGCPSAPTGRAVVLHWEFRVKGKKAGEVWMMMEDTFSRGGSGLPIEPGLDWRQVARVRRPRLVNPAKDVKLADVTAGDFVPALEGLSHGVQPPPKSRRWYQVAQKKAFSHTNAVHLTAEGKRTLVGTASQKVWAKRTSRGEQRWHWAALDDLSAGDTVWHTPEGALPITGWRRGMPPPRYARLTLGGTDHTEVNGFLVHCPKKPITGVARDGLLADTEVVLYTPDGRESRAPIGKIDVSIAERRFQRCPSFSTRVLQVRRRKDLLVNVAPASAKIICRLVYEVDGGPRSIGLAHSHGLLVERDGKLGIVPAQKVVEGDKLVCDERPDVRATVVAVGFEERPAGREWALRHPRLLRNEWVKGNGILVHADQRRSDLPAVLADTKIAVVQPPEKLNQTSWQLADPVPVQKLARFDPARLKDADFGCHLLLTCWPGSSVAPAKPPFFMPQTVGTLRRGFTADLVRVTMQAGRELYCSPGAACWKMAGHAVGGRVPVKTVLAGGLHPGDKILALKGDTGAPAVAFDVVVEVNLIDAFERFPKRGYFEVYLVELTKPKGKAALALHERYKNIFGEGILLSLRTEEKVRKDEWLGVTGPGQVPGRTGRRNLGQVLGPQETPARHNPKGLPAPDISVPRVNPPPALTFDVGDLRAFRQSLAALEAAFQTLPGLEAKGLGDGARRARFRRFARACLPDPATAPAQVLDRETLKAGLLHYKGCRALLIRAGHPAALAALARFGVPFSYLLHESGSPDVARALLGDLLTIQLRLALRPRAGKVLWITDEYRVRDTLCYTVELMKMDGAGPRPGEAAAQRFWDVRWEPRTWSDLLRRCVTGKELNADVLVQSEAGGQQALLWNLILQMDHRSGQKRVLSGLLSPGFRPGAEFSGEEFRDKFRPVR